MTSTLAGFTEPTLPCGAAAVAPTPQVTVYQGVVGSGKTACLVAHAAELLAGGVQPRDVLVLCATPTAAQAFERLLADAVSAQVDGVGEVCVTTPLGLALDVLATPEAQAATGRRNRVLCPFEVDVLLNELEPLGVEGPRLEQIVRFFERSWCDLAHREPGWLITHEERDLMALFEAGQGATGGLMPVQAVPLVADYLAGDAAACARHARAHVLIDDLLLQTRAAQVLASLLAKESLVAAGDVEAVATAFEAYPYAAGLEELLAANPQAQVVELEAPASAVRTLEATGVEVQARCTSVRERAFDDPFAEFETVARLVAQKVSAGVAPASICATAPHPTWRANLAIALEDAGVPVARVPQVAPLTADARSFVEAAVPCAFTLLQLAADRRDPVALRSWCGFGDHFLMANEFAVVYDFMAERGLDLPSALDELVAAKSDAPTARSLRAEALRGAPNVERAYESGLELVSKALDGLRGPELLQRIATLVTPDGGDGTPAASEQVQLTFNALFELCAPVGLADTAAELAQRAVGSATAPRFSLGDAAGVRLCDVREAYGAQPAFLVAAGCMNGFVPPRAAFEDTMFPGKQRERILAAEACALQGLLANAAEAVVTYTTALPAANADMLGLETARLRLKAGERVAILGRSACLG